MAIKKLIKYPALSLRAKCAEVDFKDDWFFKTDFHEHLRDLQDTLAVIPNGYALASNQILAEGWRVFVVRPNVVDLPLVMVNPKWYPHGDIATVKDEGCLSLPELWAQVARHDEVLVEYYTAEGRFDHFITQDALCAQIVQHEIDHLDGKLIIDYVPKKVQIQTRADAIRNRRAGR